MDGPLDIGGLPEAATNTNAPSVRVSGRCCAMGSLAVTYFRTGCRTIIGAVSFHGPVRDGKGWYQDAMDTRLKGGAAGWGGEALGRRT